MERKQSRWNALLELPDPFCNLSASELDVKLIEINRITPALIPELLDQVLGGSFIQQLAKPGFPIEPEDAKDCSEATESC